MTVVLTQRHARPHSCARCTIRDRAICAGMPDGKLTALENFRSGERLAAPGSHLFTEGEKTEDLLHLLDGWAMSYTLMDDGRRRVIDFILPGAFLGYRHDLSAPATHSVQCLTHCRVCVFPKGRFMDFLREHPELALSLVRERANALEGARDRLTNVTARAARDRIAHFLFQLFLQARHHGPMREGEEVRLPITQDHIADALGLTNVYVSKTLRDLREDGLMVFRGGWLRINDPARMSRAAEYVAGALAPRQIAV